LRGSSAFGANTALNAAGNIALGILGTFTGMLAARLLGPLGRGELAAIQTWPVLIGYLVLLGMGDALVYYSAREPERAGSYLTSAILLALISCGPFSLAGYIAMPLLLSAQTASVVAAARWYLLIVPLVAIAVIPLNTVRGQGDFAAWNALRLMPGLSWLAILIGAWLISCHSAVKLAQSYLLGFVVLMVITLSVVKRRISGSFRPELRNSGPLLSYGLPCMLTTLPQVLNFRLDQMVMTGFIAPFQLGLYVAAVSWSGVLTPLLYALSSSLFPALAAKSGEHERLRTFVHGARLAALGAILLGVILTLATPLGIAVLFGRGFRAAIPAGLILVPAAAVAGFNQVMQAGLRGLGRPVAVMGSEMAGLVVTVISLWLLLKPLGIVGAAIASVLGYATVTLVLLVQSRRLTGSSTAGLLIPSIDDLLGYARYMRLMMRALMAAP